MVSLATNTLPPVLCLFHLVNYNTSFHDMIVSNKYGFVWEMSLYQAALCLFAQTEIYTALGYSLENIMVGWDVTTGTAVRSEGTSGKVNQPCIVPWIMHESIPGLN